MNYSMDYDMNYSINYNKQYTSKSIFNKWLFFLYVYYLSRNFNEERDNQYGDLIIDTTYGYDTNDEKYYTNDEKYDTADEDDYYNLSIYEHDDSSNYCQAFTKAIVCLFD